jgi:hypothetical protein
MTSCLSVQTCHAESPEYNREKREKEKREREGGRALTERSSYSHLTTVSHRNPISGWVTKNVLQKTLNDDYRKQGLEMSSSHTRTTKGEREQKRISEHKEGDIEIRGSMSR